jgi:hypothetical protein
VTHVARAIAQARLGNFEEAGRERRAERNFALLLRNRFRIR